jgi:hypothetical protein
LTSPVAVRYKACMNDTKFVASAFKQDVMIKELEAQLATAQARIGALTEALREARKMAATVSRAMGADLRGNSAASTTAWNEAEEIESKIDAALSASPSPEGEK